MTNKPVLIELSETPASPADAPPVQAVSDPVSDRPEGRAMQIAARLAARPASRLARFFWQATVALLGFVISVAAWRFVESLFAASPELGWVGAGLLAVFVCAAALMGLRELAAFARLRRLDRVHREVTAAAQADDLARARKVVTHVSGLYAARPEMDWSRARLAERAPEQLDTATLLNLAETDMSVCCGACVAELRTRFTSTWATRVASTYTNGRSFGMSINRSCLAVNV